MKALILGGRGFVGSRLGRHFRSRPGWTVEALGASECDLTEARAVSYIRRRIDPSTMVVFCSTISRLREDSFRSFSQNVAMANTVAEALGTVDYGGLVFCSSIDVYGRPPLGNPIHENSAIAPSDYYGHSKFVSEFILTTELAARGHVAILRLPGIYSLDQEDPSALGTLFNRLKRNLPVHLTGGGRQIRSYLNIADLAEVVEDIGVRRWAGLVNLTSSPSVSIVACVRMMKEFLGSSSEIFCTPPNGTEFDIVISNEKSCSEFATVAFKSLSAYLGTLR